MKKVILATAIVIVCLFTTLSVISKSTETKAVKNTLKVDKSDFVGKGFGAPKNDLVAID